ncbi:TetR/AcrR family transcriptional regulator [Candidatus Leptofilum sp.]|uniref:TetR/AcrR family transcriptional regulator n=1 Tax=Candidatus Leptofilum sp. TaxID=3241576 RepID=UPI003B5CFB27
MPKIVTDSQVLEAVVQLIEANGYAGTTTKQIADIANINEVTLFRKYGSKAQLVKEAISYYADHSEVETAVQYSGDLEADLRRVVMAYYGAAELHAKVFPIIMSEIARVPELRETAGVPLGIIAKIAHLLQRYQDEGKLRPENPFQAVGALLGPLIINTMVREAGVIDSEEIVDLDEHVVAYLYGRIIPTSQNPPT